MIAPFQFGRGRHNPCDERLARCSWRRQRGQESGIDIAMDERRLSWRARAPYPARLWATDTAGRVCREDVVLDNISGGGLYVRLNRSLEKNAKLSVVVSLATAPKTSPALRLAARAVVLRVERQPDGTCGVALQFGRRRVL